ncbi:MAG: hypothetical protein ACJ0DM_03295 [Gammaproteobacteria bacterium]
MREISISSLRLFLVSSGVEISNVSPDKFGKLKTFLQMFSLSLLLIYPLFGKLFFYKRFNSLATFNFFFDFIFFKLFKNLEFFRRKVIKLSAS